MDSGFKTGNFENLENPLLLNLCHFSRLMWYFFVIRILCMMKRHENSISKAKIEKKIFLLIFLSKCHLIWKIKEKSIKFFSKMALETNGFEKALRAEKWFFLPKMVQNGFEPQKRPLNPITED